MWPRRGGPPGGVGRSRRPARAPRPRGWGTTAPTARSPPGGPQHVRHAGHAEERRDHGLGSARREAEASASATSVSAGPQRRDEQRRPPSRRRRRRRPSSSAAANSAASASGTERRGCARPRARPPRRRPPRAAPSASELPTSATRGPPGSGWARPARRRRTSGGSYSTRITPAWRNIASTAAAGARELAHQRGRAAHRRGDRPDFTTTTGLLPREPPGDPAELARVAQRLEVEHHGVGALVLLPVLHQVVAATRRPGCPPRRTSTGRARGVRRCRAGRRRARRTGRRSPSRPARRAASASSEAFSRDRRVGVDDAERVRADARACRYARASATSSALALRALGAGLGEAGRHHDQPAHALGARSRRTTSSTASAGTATTARSTGARARRRTRRGTHGTPRDLVGLGVAPRSTGPVKPPSSRCAQHRVADECSVAARRRRPPPTRAAAAAATELALGPVLARLASPPGECSVGSRSKDSATTPSSKPWLDARSPRR